MLATALPAASLAVSKLTGKFVRQQRFVMLVFFGVLALFVFLGVAALERERFADLGTMFDKGAALIQPPEHFSREETRLFSGRAYLWSQYIDAYLHGDIINILVGFGPEGWVGRFSLYAHNTFVSYLYELGLFGLAAFAWILISNCLKSLRTSGDERLVLISCHIGFFVLNLATMPFWTLEGAILYAVLLGQTWYLQSSSAASGDLSHARTARTNTRSVAAQRRADIAIARKQPLIKD
jgi:hypothetical protein